MTEASETAPAKTNNTAELFETPKLSVERLPQLRALFERVSSGCVEGFKDLFTSPAACFLNQVEAGDSWDLLDSREDCIAALFYVSEWDSQILIAIEKRLLIASVDAIFGSDGSEPQVESAQPLTTLELQIAREIFELCASCFRTAFAPLSEISVGFERIETEIEFTIMGPQNIPSVFAQLLLQIFDSGGRMFILVPRAPLMPLRKKLERGTLREAQVDDPRWTKQLQSRVSTTQISVRALAEGPTMTLADIAGLEIGQILPFDSISSSDIILASGETPMFKCRLGQLDGRLSVKIETASEVPKGLAENVLSEAMRGWGSATAAEK